MTVSLFAILSGVLSVLSGVPILPFLAAGVAYIVACFALLFNLPDGDQLRSVASE